MRIIVAASPGETRAVAIDAEGRAVDFALFRPSAPDGIGDLYRGRVTAIAPALGGAFVSLGEGADSFLPDTEGAAGVAEGALVPVRVTRAAQSAKGPRLSARLDEIVPPGPVGLVRRGPDPIRRLAALIPNAPIERAGLAFDPALEAELAALAEPVVALPGGAILRIHPTPALVAIDLDAGAAASARGPARATHRALNRAAIPEIARQIRLRNLSGAILVDLAGLSPRERRPLADAFRAALAPDPLAPRFLGLTALGFAEIVRPRVAPPLHELLLTPHAAGLAALRALASETLAAPAGAWALRAAPAVVSALEQDPAALAELARLTGRPLILRSDPALARARWSLDPL
ncbi:MAG TPA: ribonuclease E/G [Acetobacteraceae bacterium]|nr:ribonuclease E/G [Acetobacteraceae bacterium]